MALGSRILWFLRGFVAPGSRIVWFLRGFVALGARILWFLRGFVASLNPELTTVTQFSGFGEVEDPGGR